MKLRKIMIATTLAAACLATLAAAQQSDKAPIVSSTGRFGDPNSVARMYQDYLYGVIKEKNPNELILTKTKFGVDQTFGTRQENQIHPLPAPRTRSPRRILPGESETSISLFMEGGPSHLDLFDPSRSMSPRGSAHSSSFRPVITPMGGFTRRSCRRTSPLGQARPERHLGIGLVAAHRPVRRRHRGHSLLLGDGLEPFQRRQPDEHRLDPRRPGRRSAPGSPTASAPRTRTYRPSGRCRTTPLGQQRARATGTAVHAGRVSGNCASTPAASRSASPPPAQILDAAAARPLNLLEPAQSLTRPSGRSRANSTPASAATNSPSACRPRLPKRSTSARKRRKRRTSTASTTR